MVHIEILCDAQRIFSHLDAISITLTTHLQEEAPLSHHDSQQEGRKKIRPSVFARCTFKRVNCLSHPLFNGWPFFGLLSRFRNNVKCSMPSFGDRENDVRSVQALSLLQCIIIIIINNSAQAMDTYWIVTFKIRYKERHRTK